MKLIYVYTDVSSPKLDYVFDFVFKEQLGTAWERVESKANFEQRKGVRLNYSRDSIDDVVSIFQSDYFVDYANTRIPEIRDSFQQHQKSYDLFAAIFYLLARVEEYEPTPLDQHGRYPSTLSVLSNKHLLGKPIIDIWIKELSALLSNQYDIQIALSHKYAAHSTIDIDHFMAYKHKPFMIQAGSLVKDFFSLRWGRILDRLRHEDHYDTLDDLLSLHAELEARPIFFILTSDRSAYDKNLSPNQPYFKSKVKELAMKAEIGIHPSYYSKEKNSLTQELATLNSLIPKPTHKARHHFLRLHLPDTYAALLSAGITDDYTMGYPDRVGFRAGTSNSFLWYDLKNDQTTNLRVHPFCVMDVTLKQYLNLDTEAAYKVVQHLLIQLRAVEGQFSMIWHNSSFYEREGWSDWRKLYEDILRAAFSRGT